MLRSQRRRRQVEKSGGGPLPAPMSSERRILVRRISAYGFTWLAAVPSMAKLSLRRSKSA
jgi:hypothetical protein